MAEELPDSRPKEELRSPCAEEDDVLCESLPDRRLSGCVERLPDSLPASRAAILARSNSFSTCGHKNHMVRSFSMCGHKNNMVR